MVLCRFMNYIKKKEEINIELPIIFNLINDINNYKNFLPWCKNSKIISESDNHIIAEIEVKKNLVNWKFSTENKIIKNKKITMELKDGPFSHLQGFWNFKKIDKYNTFIEFYLEYEFNNKPIEFTIQPVFSLIMSSILKSFIKEAFRYKYE